MSVDTTTRRVVYEITSARTTFPFSFRVFNAGDVKVAVGTTTSTELNSSEYSVALTRDAVGGVTGGTVTTAVSPAIGTNLAIYSGVPITQPMKLTPYGGFNPETLNDSADRAIIVAQQLKEKLDRAVVVAETDSETPETLRDTLLLGKKEAEKLLTSQTAIDRLYQSAGAIDTVNQHISNVDAVASNKANVNTVAVSIGNVNTVAADIAATKTVAQHISNVDSVASSAGKVDVVSGAITSVNTVASGIADVKTVADNYVPVRNVSNELNAVKTVAIDLDTIKAAYNKVPEFRAVVEAADSAKSYVERAQAWAEDRATQGISTAGGVEIETSSGQPLAARTFVEILGGQNSAKAWSDVAGDYANSSLQSKNASAVSASESHVWAEGTDAQVAGLGGTHSAKVWAEKFLASRVAIETVSLNIANVNAVSGSIANVNIVAADKSNIDAVAGNRANIDAVNANKTNINAVNANKTNINAVADRKEKIDAIASDLTADYSSIEHAKDNADSALDSKNLAAVYASEALADKKLAMSYADSAYQSKAITDASVEKAKSWAEGASPQSLMTSGGVEIGTSSEEQLVTRTHVDVLGGQYSAKGWGEIAVANADNAKAWSEGEDSEVEALGGDHSAKRWAEICRERNQADWTETSPGSGSFIAHKPVIDSETSLTSTNAISNKAISQRIEEIWHHIYNNLGVEHLLNTSLGVDIFTSGNEVLIAGHP